MTTTPTLPEAMGAERRAQEPSMEDILASIRRIIADDKMLPNAPAPRAEEPCVERPSARAEEASARDHDDGVGFEHVSREAASALRNPPPQSARAPSWRVAPTWRESVADAPRATTPRADIVAPTKVDQAGLLSPQADASVASAFHALATTVMAQNAGQIEETVRETLRPMLRQWLDDHLPMMVERLVRAEIERVSRGGR